MNTTMHPAKRIACVVMAFAVAFTLGLAPSLATSVDAAHASTASKLKSTCNKIVKNKAKGSTSKAKLASLAKYVENNSGYSNFWKMEGKASPGTISKAKSKTYALKFLTKKTGSCYHYAAGFAYLAKAACPKASVRIGYSYKKVVMPGSKNPQDHAWTEVKLGSTWYVYDTNMDKFYAAKKGAYSGKYIGKTRTKMKSRYANYKGAKCVYAAL